MNEQGYESRHHEVQDFDWVRGGVSPNWTMLEEGETRFGDAEIALVNENIIDVDSVLDKVLPFVRQDG